MRVNGMRSLFSELFVVLSINLLGAVVACLNDRNRIATFIENWHIAFLIFRKNWCSIKPMKRLA